MKAISGGPPYLSPPERGGGPAACSYAVAGVRVCCDRPLPGLDEDGWTDGEVSVGFADTAAGASEVCAGAAGRWHVLPPQCGWEGVVAEDGSALRLAEPVPGRGEASVAVRQTVPFAAVLQGKVVLHAAAAACAGGVAVFTGASGAGKTTLAAALGARRIPVYADDLVPCRMSGGRIVAPVRGAAGAWALVPVARIFFLRSRGPGRPTIDCVATSQGETVLGLVRNGFGELAVGRVWQTQLALYAALAEQAEAFGLVLPDGLERLAAAAGEVAAVLDRPAAPGAPR